MSSVELQSEQHRQLLDIIDRLRSKGISKYVDLPEIVVCGDQSAGKSSVLEAISGMSFPTKDNLCTRFATELVLRRAQNETVKISITAGPNRTERERQRLSEFGYDFENEMPDLGEVVEKAKEVMGLSDVKRFSTDFSGSSFVDLINHTSQWWIFQVSSELETKTNRLRMQILSEIWWLDT
jgi:hypothetical protein